MADDAPLLAALAVIQARGAIGERALVEAVAHADRFVALIPPDARTLVDLGSGGGLPALVIAWRAFRRFGPPVAEAPALAMGKRQLARNGAALVERARRVHLLAPPYAALIAARIAEALGIREADPEAREAAIARVLAERGLATDYAERADALRRARHPAELLRAASALKTIERTVTP